MSAKKEKNVKNNNIYIMPALGEFGNVYLTEEELEKLKERFPYENAGSTTCFLLTGMWKYGYR